MDELIERMKVICKHEDLTREELAAKTEMTYTRWHNLMNNRGVIKPEEIVKTGNAFPEYKHWIVFGEEIPEVGQISPMTKEARKSLGTQGKAG
ncbi:XRE family transcriptional regulator [Marinimicrobium sp. C2-29]|uniref:XRE family transcriptional regulator n=1 Tax=Marinimicrobium sp. C2-29 TaxID=3139825 RepID=UPI003139969D